MQSLNGTAPYIKNYDAFEEDTDDGTTLRCLLCWLAHLVLMVTLFGVAVIDAGADSILSLSGTGQKTSSGGAASEATRPSLTWTLVLVLKLMSNSRLLLFVAPTPWAAVGNSCHC